MALASRARNNGFVIGGEWLHQAAHIRRETVSRAIKDLEALGAVKVQRRKPLVNYYWLQHPPEPSRVGAYGPLCDPRSRWTEP